MEKKISGVAFVSLKPHIYARNLDDQPQKLLDLDNFMDQEDDESIFKEDSKDVKKKYIQMEVTSKKPEKQLKVES